MKKYLYVTHNCKLSMKNENFGIIDKHTCSCHMSNVVLGKGLWPWFLWFVIQCFHPIVERFMYYYCLVPPRMLKTPMKTQFISWIILFSNSLLSIYQDVIFEFVTSEIKLYICHLEPQIAKFGLLFMPSQTP
jgi:hypothetical protein